MSRFIPSYKFFYKKAFIQPAVSAMKGISGRVLDLGCGDGLEIRTIARARPNLEYFGVDKDKKAIAKAKKFDSGINFKVANAEKLSFPDSYFSAVICLEVLEHVKHPDKVMKEVERVLKPDGVFYFTTPLEGDPVTLYGFLYRRFGYDPNRALFDHIQKFSYPGLRRRIESSGFKVLQVTFAAHYLNQIYSIFLRATKKVLGEKISVVFLPITYIVSIISGVETMLFRNMRGGLNTQIVCKKV